MPRNPDNGKKDGGWRIAFGLLPWVDALLLCSAAAFFLGKAALVPGQPVELPKAGFTDGAADCGRPVFLIAGRHAGGDAASFNGVCYFMSNAVSRTGFIETLRKEAPEGTLVIYADKSIPHGRITDFLSVLREAGIKQVDFAVDPD